MLLSKFATVTRACFHHIRRLKQIRRLLGKDVAAGLVSAFILSRVDYCNTILAGLPKSTIAPLQRVQNAAARLVTRLGPREHVTSTIRDLHWLPVQHRITYKLCLMMHLVNIGRAPTYLINSVTATRDVVSRSRLRSSSSHCYEQPRTRHKLGERSFIFAGPAPGTVYHHRYMNSRTQSLSKNISKPICSLVPLVHSFYIHIVSCCSFLQCKQTSFMSYDLLMWRVARVERHARHDSQQARQVRHAFITFTLQRTQHRVGHGLDPSMDWIGLDWIGSDDCNPLFCSIYIFFILTTDKR